MDIRLIRRKVKAQEYDLSEHAHQERQEEQITKEEIEKTLLKGSIIEEYPEDPRGGGCLDQRNLFGLIGKQEQRS